MLFNIILVAMCTWITVYSASYARFEGTSGNRNGMTAIFALCFINLIFTALAVII